jgi:methylthioribose-1-phosphate isomerase
MRERCTAVNLSIGTRSLRASASSQVRQPFCQGRDRDDMAQKRQALAMERFFCRRVGELGADFLDD